MLLEWVEGRYSVLIAEVEVGLEVKLSVHLHKSLVSLEHHIQ